MTNLFIVFVFFSSGFALHVPHEIADAALEAADSKGARDLAFMHIPYNFGHTVERVALLGHVSEVEYNLVQANVDRLAAAEDYVEAAAVVDGLKEERGGEVWGHFVPTLSKISEVTGCPLYFTPQKYWPTDYLAAYFGNKTVFGNLRDPYERLVAFFRGNIPGYGGSYPEFFETCDVNGAVKQMLENYLAGDRFAQDCTFLPQAEFFEGPYGITVPVNNRLFPDSANEVLAEHGYDNIEIEDEEVMHVTGCPNVWAGDLEEDTKALVRQVYARDFELLCEHFGYCDTSENVCLAHIEQMCPEKAFNFLEEENLFVPKSAEFEFTDSPKAVQQAPSSS